MYINPAWLLLRLWSFTHPYMELSIFHYFIRILLVETWVCNPMMMLGLCPSLAAIGTRTNQHG